MDFVNIQKIVPNLKRSKDKGKMCRDKLPFMSICDHAEHCIDGLTCRRKLPTNEFKHCLAKLGAGNHCALNTDCKQKHSCYDGVCERTGTEYGKFCTGSRECKGALVCVNSKCSICRKNIECPANHVCQAFKCVKQ